MGTFLLHSISLAMLLLIPSCVETEENDKLLGDRARAGIAENQRTDGPQGRLAPDSTIGRVLNHPALAGFGHLTLPWDDRAYDETLPLSAIDSLLPYHTNVDPGVVVSGLNRMIDDVTSGNQVFYNIYDKAQMRARPDKEKTGLFFFRGKPGAPFAIISPGGGFSYVGSVHEGFPYAEEISSKGYNAFVLKYRVGMGGKLATEDLAAAVSYVFRNAESLRVGTENYSLWGSSAGARMAAAIGSHGVAAFGGVSLPRPEVVVMAYTAHSDFSDDEPNTYAVVGERDGIAPPSAMERRVSALRKGGAVVEYHVYNGLGHGFGSGVGTSAEGWIDDAVRFWGTSKK